MKKQKGTEEQTKIDPLTGEVTQNKHEYCTMSRKPGIGYDWFKKYKTDVFPHDVCRNKTITSKKTNSSQVLPELLNNPLHEERNIITLSYMKKNKNKPEKKNKKR